MSIGVSITIVNEIHHSAANYVDSVVRVCTIESLSIEVKVKVIRMSKLPAQNTPLLAKSG